MSDAYFHLQFKYKKTKATKSSPFDTWISICCFLNGFVCKAYPFEINFINDIQITTIFYRSLEKGHDFYKKNVVIPELQQEGREYVEYLYTLLQNGDLHHPNVKRRKKFVKYLDTFFKKITFS